MISMSVGIFSVPDNLTADEMVDFYIRHILKLEEGNKTKAAQRLGIDRRTLYRRIQKAA